MLGIFLFSFILILDDSVRAEAVSIGGSCSGGVALLPCGSRLMQAARLETLNLNLTWRKNGEEFIPNPDTEVSQEPCWGTKAMRMKDLCESVKMGIGKFYVMTFMHCGNILCHTNLM